MGLFDFLSRKKEQPDAGSSANEPRCDHYSFTHQVLRQAAFNDPTRCVSTLGSTECDEYLATLWEAVEQTCEQFDRPVELSPSDILIHRLRVGAYPCALVELPTPAAPGEAFYVALVLTFDLADRSKGFAEHPLRYITLEETGRGGGALTTVLCEWTSEDSHLDHGTGPYPTIEEFMACVAELVTERQKL